MRRITGNWGGLRSGAVSWIVHGTFFRWVLTYWFQNRIVGLWLVLFSLRSCSLTVLWKWECNRLK